jgi:hypothetical protein
VKYFTNPKLITQPKPRNEDDLIEVCCNEVLAILIYKMGWIVSSECLRELTTFVLLFRAHLNQNGYEQLKQKEDPNNAQEETSLPEFCQNKTAEHILETSNWFIIEFLPNHFQQNPFEANLIGKSTEKLKITVHVTKHFSNWLYDNRFTNSKLKINEE